MFCFCVLAPKEWMGGEVNRCAEVCVCVCGGGASLILREVAACVKPLSADSNDTGANAPNPEHTKMHAHVYLPLHSTLVCSYVVCVCVGGSPVPQFLACVHHPGHNISKHTVWGINSHSVTSSHLIGWKQMLVIR